MRRLISRITVVVIMLATVGDARAENQDGSTGIPVGSKEGSSYVGGATASAGRTGKVARSTRRHTSSRRRVTRRCGASPEAAATRAPEAATTTTWLATDPSTTTTTTDDPSTWERIVDFLFGDDDDEVEPGELAGRITFPDLPADGQPIVQVHQPGQVPACPTPSRAPRTRAEANLQRAVQAVVALPAATLDVSPTVDGLCGLPTWLWDDAASPAPQSFTLGDLTGTVEATPLRWTWTTGDGATYSSEHPGTEAAPATTHVYTTAGPRSPGLSIDWGGSITWTSARQRTPQHLDLGGITITATFDYTVREVQAVVTGAT